MRTSRALGSVLAAGALLITAASLLASPTPAWVASLDVENGVQREAAIEQLATSSTLAPTLISALESEYSSRIKAGAAEVLRRMSLSSAEQASVATRLSANDFATRTRAVKILASNAASHRVALAQRALDEGEAVSVRTAAATALGGTGPQARAALRPLVLRAETPEALRRAAIRSLAQVSELGRVDVRTLAASATASRMQREVAIAALAQLEGPGDPYLVQLLTGASARLRAAAVTGLARDGEASNVAVVAQRLTDPAPIVRLAALRGLRRMEQVAAKRSAISVRMSDSDVRVQALAARSMSQAGSDFAPTAVPALQSLLASPSFLVRYEAALALLAYQDTSGQAAMQAALTSANPSVVARASAALTQIQNASW